MGRNNKKLLDKILPMIIRLDRAIANKELCFDNKRERFEWLDIEHKRDREPTIIDELRERCGDDYDLFSPGLGSQILSKYLDED